MDPVRSRVRGIHRKQREKFLSLNDYEHHVALRRAKKKSRFTVFGLYCISGMASLLRYLGESNEAVFGSGKPSVH